ncbi:MAG: hypothetical protein KA244_01385, partial [Deltaproteobacteria bacterium]|nr:hypothetical protein [Deltaproteobacteria bacterium]
MASAPLPGPRSRSRPFSVGHGGPSKRPLSPAVLHEAPALQSAFEPVAGGAPGQVQLTMPFRLRRFQNWFFLGLMYCFFYMSRYNF